MENQEQYLSQLYQDFLDSKVSPEQAGLIKEMFGNVDEPTLRHLISTALKNEQTNILETVDEQIRLDEIYARVKTEAGVGQKRPRKARTVWYTVGGIAAAFVMLIASLLYVNNAKRPVPSKNADLIAAVAPGSNKAILTLSNGTRVDLSGANPRQITDGSGQLAVYSGDGTISYHTFQAPTTSYNSIETPKGGEFKVVLPDGTKVWLNAASSLRYPTSFGALNERRIELSGEAYFEVSHDKAKPFRVVTAVQTVEVLGTHFNINSYADEGRTTTTLAEGSVRVISSDKQSILKPGQRAVLPSTGSIEVSTADMETALAWKDGNIIFKSADLQTIMRQVERWYNITVRYEGKTTNRKFTGGMPRSTKLSVLLDVLKDSNIDFRMQETPSGRTLIVTN